ncbi:MAG: hypothetical protein V4850_33585 [Myxococcota bacterium]
MDDATLHRHLSGPSLRRLLAAIQELPSDFPLTDADVAGMLRIWYVETAGFDDLLVGARACLDRYVKHKLTLPLDDLQGSIQFLIGVLDGRRDASGFLFLGSGLTLAVSIELAEVAELLREAHPDDVGPLDALSGQLDALEGIHHGVYHRLRTIGAQHLVTIEESLSRMTPTNADMVLHALDSFVGNAEVAALYERMIDRLPEDTELREVFAKYLSRVRPAGG